MKPLVTSEEDDVLLSIESYPSLSEDYYYRHGYYRDEGWEPGNFGASESTVRRLLRRKLIRKDKKYGYALTKRGEQALYHERASYQAKALREKMKKRKPTRIVMIGGKAYLVD
jgi:hypothetical protein